MHDSRCRLHWGANKHLPVRAFEGVAVAGHQHRRVALPVQDPLVVIDQDAAAASAGQRRAVVRDRLCTAETRVKKKTGRV